MQNLTEKHIAEITALLTGWDRNETKSIDFKNDHDNQPFMRLLVNKTHVVLSTYVETSIPGDAIVRTLVADVAGPAITFYPIAASQHSDQVADRHSEQITKKIRSLVLDLLV